MRRIALLASALLFAAPALAAPEIKIAQGALSGASEDGVDSFKNIPFAAPPVGALRWRAPQPAPSWTDTRPAREYGPICPQNYKPSLFAPRLPQSEDCLSLNVWMPQGASGAKLPAEDIREAIRGLPSRPMSLPAPSPRGLSRHSRRW